MSTRTTTALAAALAVGLSLAARDAAADDTSFALDKTSKVLAPTSFGGLTLFPVVTTAKPGKDRDYLVLDEGMKRKLVKVIEKGDGEVNELELENQSDKPLFLMAGEVVIGGKQDRIIGKNTVIEAKHKESIPVFCVEHGRWTGRKAEFESANTLAHKELREKASFGDQSEVWAEVKSKNAKRKVSNDTDTYRRVALDKTVKQSIAGYHTAFAALAKAKDADRRVGYVVAMNGKVVAIEVFGSPSLFRKLERKLLDSYYVEAIDNASGAAGGATAAKPPAAAAVVEFHGKARAAKKTVVLDKASGKTLQFDSEDLKASEVEGKDGDTVYEGAYH
jgi:hypothetical protein